MEKLFARLIVTHQNKERGTVKFQDARKNICDAVDLAMVDYMLSRFGSLERYKEEAIKNQNRWITSKEVTLSIEDVNQNAYPLPFDTKYNDIIFKASESAVINGDSLYIIKGEGNQMVNDSEFHDFFNDFLACVLSEEGYALIKNGYFDIYPDFNRLLNEYYQLNQKEDDIYSEAKTNRIEKSYLSAPRTPNTLDDFLRNYPIFRKAISFNIKCLEMRNENKVEKSKRIEPVIMPKDETPSIQRSLCYLIGNNCEPLRLKTMDAYSLDDYIINHYSSAKEIIRENEAIIRAYILSNKEYVQQIRDLIQNPKYSGQLTILEYNPDGSFKRLSNGNYLRLPVLYTDTFKKIRSLYCNIDLFRNQVRMLKKKMSSLETQTLSTKTQEASGKLESDLKEVLAKLEEEQKVTKEELERVMFEIKKVIEDMQKLEQSDYAESQKNPAYNRLFSEYVSKKVRYTQATGLSCEYKRTLDEWASSIENSPNRYDNVRSIFRHLKKKEISNTPTLKTEIKKENGNSKEVSQATVTDNLEKKDEYLSIEELKQMYGEDLPPLEELEKKNIYVQK